MDTGKDLGDFAGTPDEVAPYLKEIREEAWLKRCPKRFQRSTLDTLSEQVLGDVQYWKKARVLESGTNLILSGPRGVGKTHIAYAVLRDQFLRGTSVLAWQTVDLFDALRPGGDHDTGKVLRDLGDVEILLLDDVGATRTTDWTLERFTGLVDQRYRENLATIITTNLNQNEITDVIGLRAADRLYGGSVQVLLTGPSRRVPLGHAIPGASGG
jgi:DNA replication protein DnaC